MNEYNAKDVTVTIGGRLITGFGEDAMVAIARDNDSFEDKIGVDGNVSVSHSNDKRGNITLTLMDTSADNSYLSGLLNGSERARTLQTFAVTVLDNKTGDIYECPIAWVKRPADSEKGREVSEKEWMIRCENLTMIEGGS